MWMELDNLSQMNSAGHRQQKLYYSFLNEASRICIITEIEGRLVVARVRGSRVVFQLFFYCCEDTMGNSTYRTKSLLGLAVSVSEGESMIIMVESMKHGSRQAWRCSSSWELASRSTAREFMWNVVGFWTPRDTPHPSQTVPPSADYTFKYMRMWWTIVI